MDPITAGLQLANTIGLVILEAYKTEPPEVTKAKALLAFDVLWAVMGPLVPQDTRNKVEALLSQAKAH